ncbi:hypothetical protein Fmac_009855 [Flemingia macrophylla]|uniref:Uncharacterized protein n=1 Tax=Flemingia macrophylla TaxID=520843 RepID=A0ABD1N3Z0_9FABA
MTSRQLNPTFCISLSIFKHMLTNFSFTSHVLAAFEFGFLYLHSIFRPIHSYTSVSSSFFLSTRPG